ncbi:hypothetical protein [Cupriavidus sp. D39]|uniref:hypothetical protein n=1 Tax=Cupriavidus sp. D39 TaxID=2997877 RepID=UPI00226D9445|nr:hypothetical protein [Cupriavidus sp. D39]MCY0854297.1 hypothetical protein [Cupriavidus sp. D39]
MVRHPTYDQILAMPLRQQALALHERGNRARTQELKDMAAALALLELEHGAIKAAGYTIHGDAVRPVYRERMTLSVMGSVFEGDRRLCRALLTAGFNLVQRSEHRLGSVRFKKGRLTISVVIDAEKLAQAESEAAAALSANTEEVAA